MTVIFYETRDWKVPLKSGGFASPQHVRRLALAHDEIMLGKDGVRVRGTKVKVCTLFAGDDPPQLLRDDVPLNMIRGSKKLSKHLPKTYIDRRGNVCEGATGKIIFGIGN